MKKLTIKFIIAICTFIIGIGAVVTWLYKPMTNPSVVSSSNESVGLVAPALKDEEVSNDFSPIIELWLANKIKGNKMKFSNGNNSIVGELIQLNAGREKQLLVTTCPNQSKDYIPNCIVDVYEKNEKSYKKLPNDKLNWHYFINDGEMSGSIFARWQKGIYKDLHILSNGVENIYIYDGSKYTLQKQIQYTM